VTIWLAAYLEGEGSFLMGPPSSPNLPKVTFQTTDEDIAQRVATWWSVKAHPAVAKKAEWKNTWRVTLIGRRAVELMDAVRPLMGKRRQGQIDAAINSYHPQARKIDPTTLEAILEDLATGMNQTLIGTKYGLCRGTICRISSGTRERDQKARKN